MLCYCQQISQYKIFLLVQNAAIVAAAATEGGHSAGSSCFPFLLSLTLPHVFFVGLKVGEVQFYLIRLIVVVVPFYLEIPKGDEEFHLFVALIVLMLGSASCQADREIPIGIDMLY